MSLYGLQPQQELALQAGARLTPYLKLGGCASPLLSASLAALAISFRREWTRMDTARRPQTFRVIGRRTPKVDALDKVTGRAQFGADIALPRMLVGRVLGGPYAHARITGFGTSRVAASAGVRPVIRGTRLPRGMLGAAGRGGV